MDNFFAILKSFRGEMKKSRFKIWLRAFLFIQFSALFGFYFFRDIGNGYFSWMWVALLFALFIPVGFLMSLIVPMKADLKRRAVILSLDRVYLFLIWLLVIAKLIIGRIPRSHSKRISSCVPFWELCSDGWAALGCVCVISKFSTALFWNYKHNGHALGVTIFFKRRMLCPQTVSSQSFYGSSVSLSWG